jgi:hypothetical protein
VIAVASSFNDPDNNDFSLKSTAPAIDSGVDLGSNYSSDFVGISRPQSLAWDIGAYEFNGILADPTPTPTPTCAIKLIA